MPSFRYEALDASGRSRRGEIEADDVTAASELLKSQALVVLAIELVESTRQAVSTRGSVSTDPSLDYEERINSLLRQPDRLIQLLNALAAEPASTPLRKELSYLLQALQSGVDAKRFLEDPRLCIWLPILTSANQAEDVDVRYTQWLNQVMDERTRRVGLIATFSYPLILLGFVLLVFIPICVFIVPEFQKMYREFGLMLPRPTSLLFSIADLVNLWPHYLILAAAVVLSLIAGFCYWWVSRALTTYFFGWLIGGNSVSLVAMSRLTSVLAELLELGAPVPEAVVLAGKASRHPFYRNASLELAVQMSAHEVNWRALPIAESFPFVLMHALGAAEGKPSVPLIRELSHVYSDRVSARLGRRFGAATPLVVVVVGLAVAFVVISLFMPMVSLITSLS